MLYVTTRNSELLYTSHHALINSRDGQGGLYLPYQPVRLTQSELDDFNNKSFNQCVADILNIFFSARLDAWDIACCMGDHPLKLIPMSHKITIAEVWNNPEWNLSRFVRNLNCRILGNIDSGCPSNWTEIAVRIAVLFGIFAKLSRIGVVSHKKTIDISVVSGEFISPMSAWYARAMGLPIGTIVFSCNDNSSVWDLLHHSSLNTKPTIIATTTPMCDVGLPANIECLIYETLGRDEVTKFADLCSAHGIYTIPEEDRITASNGMFGAVIGQSRVKSIIKNVYATSAYILSPYSALAYGGLQDYRATKAEVGQTLILTENGPLYTPEFVSDALGLSQDELKNRIMLV